MTKHTSTDDWYGNATTNGLFFDYANNGLEDAIFDISSITVSIDGRRVSFSSVDYLGGNPTCLYEKKSTHESLYSSCFHDDYREINFENSNLETGTLLIICDPYSSCMERF